MTEQMPVWGMVLVGIVMYVAVGGLLTTTMFMTLPKEMKTPSQHGFLWAMWVLWPVFVPIGFMVHLGSFRPLPLIVVEWIKGRRTPS